MHSSKRARIACSDWLDLEKDEVTATGAGPCDQPTLLGEKHSRRKGRRSRGREFSVKRIDVGPSDEAVGGGGLMLANGTAGWGKRVVFW